MRSGLILLFIAIAFACKQTDLAPTENPSTTETESSSVLPFADTEKPSETASDDETTENATSKVWVCKSSGATKYHYNRDCGGLKRCTHQIVESNVKDAEAIGLGQCSYKKCR